MDREVMDMVMSVAQECQRKTKTTSVERLDHHSRGFTLIELSVILVVLSIIAINLVITDTDIKEIGKADITRERMERVHEAMQKYAQDNYRFPCPAVVFARETSVNFGNATGNPGDCDDGDIAGILTSEDDDVYYGAVPVRELGLPAEYAFDGWDRRIQYVVARDTTDVATYMDESPVKLLNNYTNSTSQNTAWYENNHQHTRFDNVPYLFLSFGEDGQGAYSRVPTVEGEGAVLDYLSGESESNYAEALNNKRVNLSGSGDESELNHLFAMPSDVQTDFNDIVSVGVRYPTSIDYPEFDPRALNQGETQQEDDLNLFMWFNTDSNQNFTNTGNCSGTDYPTDGEEVDCWIDISGNSRDLTDEAGMGRPVFIANAIDADSGNPGNALRFDGDDLLRRAEAFDFPVVYMMVIRAENWSAQTVLDNVGAFFSDENGIKLSTTGNGRFDGVGNGSPNIQGPSFSSPEEQDDLYVLTLVLAADQTRFYVNGEASTVATTPTNPPLGGVTVGADRANFNFFDGDVMELVIFEGRISDSTRHIAERFLAAKWTDESHTDHNIDMVAQ